MGDDPNDIDQLLSQVRVAGRDKPAPYSDAEMDALMSQIPVGDGPPGFWENTAAGAVEAPLALIDLLSLGGSWLGEKAGLLPEDFEPLQYGQMASDALGLDPDRESWGYLGGNVLGGGFVGGARAAGRNALQGNFQEAGRAMGRSMGVEATAAAGSEAGASIGEDMGGETGELIGGLAGAFTPAPAGYLGRRVGQGLLADDTAAQRLQAADELDVPLSLGIVGNKPARYMENFFGVVPIASTFVNRRQNRQNEAWGRALDETAEGMRTNNLGENPAPPPVTTLEGAEIPPGDPGAWDYSIPGTKGFQSEELGQQVRDIADQGYRQMKDTFSRREDALAYDIGARTPVDTAGLTQRLRELQRSTDPARQRVLQAEIDDIMAMRTQTDEFQQLAKEEQALRRHISVLERVKGVPPADIRSARAALQRKQQEMADFTGVAYEQLRDWRSGVGQRTKQAGISGGQQSRVYEAATDAVRQAARNKGLDAEFDALMRDQRRARDTSGSLAEGGEMALAKKLMDTGENDKLAAWVRGSAQHRPAERLIALRKLAGGNDTPRWRQFVGDFYRHLAQANRSEQDATGIAMSAGSFLTKWDGLDGRTKNILREADPTLYDKVEAVAVMANTLKERGKAANPSGTTTMAIPAMLGSGLATNAARTAGVMAGALGGTQLVLSQRLARILGEEGPGMGERLTERAGAAARQGYLAAEHRQEEN